MKYSVVQIIRLEINSWQKLCQICPLISNTIWVLKLFWNILKFLICIYIIIFCFKYLLVCTYVYFSMSVKTVLYFFNISS